MASWLLLVLGVIAAALTWNVHRPSFTPARRAVASFFAGWLTLELALHHVAISAVVTIGLVMAGALERFAGRLGLLVTIGSSAALCVEYLRGFAARGIVERALEEALGAAFRERIRPEIASKLDPGVGWRRILRPFSMRHPEVERIRDIVFDRVRGLDLKLDVYRRRVHPQGCPVLLEIHGGAWIIGTKDQQGIPLMLRMAAQGWISVAANYRLSPHATFPEHIVDVKKAIQWIREHGREYGADPEFIVVTGQSAGGHLASLAALTANRPEFQPAFESIDTAVHGCVSFYGVYDFMNRAGHEELHRLLERKVMKGSLDEVRELYESGSPFHRVHADAPPFFVIHGERDTLVRVGEARRFFAALKARSRAPVAYAEIPGAQHAFELFPSLRSELVLGGVESFLALLWSDFLAARQWTPQSAPSTGAAQAS